MQTEQLECHFCVYVIMQRLLFAFLVIFSLKLRLNFGKATKLGVSLENIFIYAGWQSMATVNHNIICIPRVGSRQRDPNSVISLSASSSWRILTSSIQNKAWQFRGMFFKVEAPCGSRMAPFSASQSLPKVRGYQFGHAESWLFVPRRLAG